MKITDKIKDYFDKIKYTSTEPRGTKLGRKCIKKNGTYVLRNDNGKVLIKANWISDAVNNVRFFKDNNEFLGVIQPNENGILSGSTFYIDDIKNITYEALPKYLDKVTFIDPKTKEQSSLLIDKQNNVSPLYKSIAEANKNGLRIAEKEDGYTITKENGTPVLDLIDISGKDVNNVRVGRVSQGKLVFLAKNFDENFIYCSTVEPLNYRNYKATLEDGKVKVLSANGNETIEGTFDSAEALPTYDIVINKSDIYNPFGKKYKRPADSKLKFYSTKYGILGYAYKNEYTERLFSSPDSSIGHVVDPDIAKIYMSMLDGKKPSKTCIQKIISENPATAQQAFIDGRKAFIRTLEEAKTGYPIKDKQIDEAINNLDISPLFKKKISGCKGAITKNEKKIDKTNKSFKQTSSEINQILNHLKTKKDNKINDLEGSINKCNQNIDIYSKVVDEIEKNK